jgi:hypothetical protein
MNDTRGWIQIACDGDVQNNIIRNMVTLADAIEAYEAYATNCICVVDKSCKEVKTLDLKTLEYMEERAKKGRDLVNRIEDLKETVYKLENCNITNIQFRDTSGNIWAWAIQSRAVEKMKDAAIQVAKEEINLLEQELAEL